MEPREPTLVYPPRWRLVPLIATCALFAGASALAAGAAQPTLAMTGLIGLAGFGAAALVLLARAVRPGPTLRIDADGITDRTTLAPTGLVRWEEIAGVRKRELGRGMGAERLLEVVLVDPDRFMRRPRPLLRHVTDQVRRLTKQPPVTIPGSMVAVSMGELVAALQRWRPVLDVMELPPPRPRLFRRREPARRHPDLPRW